LIDVLLVGVLLVPLAAALLRGLRGNFSLGGEGEAVGGVGLGGRKLYTRKKRSYLLNEI